MKSLFFAIVVLLAEVASVRADVLTGCPVGFNVGGGGECYWTQALTGVTEVDFTGLNWNNYELLCSGITASQTGGNQILMQWGEGTPTTWVNASYKWVQSYGSGTTPGVSSNNSDVAFDLFTFTGPLITPLFTDLKMGPFSRDGYHKKVTGTEALNVGPSDPFYAATFSGYYGHSLNPITGIRLLAGGGSMNVTCTLYAHPGG